MTQEMLEIKKRQDALWFVFPNSISMYNCREIENRIMSVLDSQPTGMRIVVDFSPVVNLFSSGIGLLIRLRKKVSEMNGYICLVNVQEKTKKLISDCHLDRVFDVFATDVEYEISQKDIVRNKLFGEKIGFVFAAIPENGTCRINLSGYLTSDHDLSHFRDFVPDATLSRFIFDLENLDLMDSTGIAVFVQLLMKIKKVGGVSVAYGANEIITDLINLVSINELIDLCQDENAAIDFIKQRK